MRLYEPFPAKVRGEDADGVSFEIDTVLDNIGPSGLYLRLARNVSQGSTIFIAVRLSPAPGKTVFASTIAFRGIVERSEPGPDGRCGLAVSLAHDPLLTTILSGLALPKGA
jgi:hypothetical protein